MKTRTEHRLTLNVFFRRRRAELTGGRERLDGIEHAIRELLLSAGP
jgi:hypothetical protein